MSRKSSRKASTHLDPPSLGADRRATRRRPRQQEQRAQLTRTLLWGGAIAGGIVWMAWPDEETGRILRDRESCASVTEVSRAECEAAYDQAYAAHTRLAPRFDSLHQCQEQFGSCHADPDNSIYWIPPFAGFLLGYRQRDDDVGSGGTVSGYRYTGALPLYRERRGDFLDPRGDTVGSGGKVTGRAGAIDPPSRALTISRSGFGSSASARSSFGG